MRLGPARWLAAVLLVLPASARAWEVRIPNAVPGNGEAVAAVVATDGDIVAAGHVQADDAGPAFAVVRLAAGDGAERWRRVLLPGGGADPFLPDGARAVVLDQNGDVIVAGATSQSAAVPQFTVVKLVGTTGAGAWRYDWPGPGRAFAVTVDAAGDVLAAGSTAVPMVGEAFTVVKLGGDNGMQVWATQLEATFLGGKEAAVAMQPDQDVIASGWTKGAGDLPVAVVVRLDRATGDEVWRSTPAEPDCPGRLAISPGGDVFAAGGHCTNGAVPWQQPVLVRRLDGDTGAQEWSRGVGVSEALALDPDANPIVVTTEFTGLGRFGIAPTEFRVLRLALANGAIVAERDFSGDGGCEYGGCNKFGEGGGGAVTPSGDVVVTGVLGRIDSRLTTARLGGSALETVWLRNDPHWHTAPGNFAGNAVVVGPDGRVAIPGFVGQFPPTGSTGSTEFGVLVLDGTTGALDACGDAIADPSEGCDDGLADAGCCAADCTATVADGTACDDFDACTLGDRCAAGGCRGTEPLPCAPCGTCDPRAGCRTDQALTCGEPTASHAATLEITQNPRGRRHVGWVMRSGPATEKSQFGDPLSSTDYVLCAFAGYQVVARAVAPGGRCNGKRCWKQTRHGFEYRNPKAPDGIARMSLRAGGFGSTRLEVAAKGSQLLSPTLPRNEDDRFVVELRRADEPTACWAAYHTLVEKNRADLFRATNE